MASYTPKFINLHRDDSTGPGFSVGTDPGTIEMITTSPWASYPVPPIPYGKGYMEFYKIPNGSKNVHFKMPMYCGAHNATIQVFHLHGGKLLTGIPASLSIYRNGTGDPLIDALCKPTASESFSAYARRVYSTTGKCMWFSTLSLARPYTLLHENKTPLDLIMERYDDVTTWNKLQAVDPFQVPMGFESNTREVLSDMLRTLYPDVFPSNFIFDDSDTNEGGRVFKKTSNDMTTFNVDGETIHWTGNTFGGFSTNSGSGSSDNLPYEELFIEEVYCTIIIGIIASHYFQWEASWDERDDPDPDPCRDTYGNDYLDEPDPPTPPTPVSYTWMGGFVEGQRILLG